MSLKAKIEAVIYASEEPVTLAQLTGLLGHEAQAELDHLDAAQHSLALEAAEQAQQEDEDGQLSSSVDEDAMNQEILEDAEPQPAEPEPAPAEAAEPAPGASAAETSATEAPAAAEQGSNAPAEAESSDKKSTQESKAEKEKARRLREYFRSLLDSLIADYANAGRGLEIREVAGGYRLATKPEYHDAVRGFVKSLKPPLKLSLQALETLAVVAYKQPVTAPEISEIRGVDSGGVLGSLITRKLITTAGRKQVIGRPILYKTTKDFLLRFGLKDINELPSIEEFEKMAGELADAEPVQEEIPMPEAHASHSATPPHHAPESPSDLEPERNTHAPQADGSPDIADNPLDIEVEDALEENPLKEDFDDDRHPHHVPEEPQSSDDNAPDAGDEHVSETTPAAESENPSAEEAAVQGGTHPQD